MKFLVINSGSWWVRGNELIFNLFNVRRWCYGEGFFWFGVRDGDDENDWKI